MFCNPILRRRKLALCGDRISSACSHFSASMIAWRFSSNAPAIARGVNRTLAPLMSNSTLNYSARTACMGLILVARLAGSHAEARVNTATATMAIEMATGSSGLNS